MGHLQNVGFIDQVERSEILLFHPYIKDLSGFVIIESFIFIFRSLNKRRIEKIHVSNYCDLVYIQLSEN